MNLLGSLSAALAVFDAGTLIIGHQQWEGTNLYFVSVLFISLSLHQAYIVAIYIHVYHYLKLQFEI